MAEGKGIQSRSKRLIRYRGRKDKASRPPIAPLHLQVNTAVTTVDQPRWKVRVEREHCARERNDPPTAGHDSEIRTIRLSLVSALAV